MQSLRPIDLPRRDFKKSCHFKLQAKYWHGKEFSKVNPSLAQIVVENQESKKIRR